MLTACRGPNQYVDYGMGFNEKKLTGDRTKAINIKFLAVNNSEIPGTRCSGHIPNVLLVQLLRVSSAPSCLRELLLLRAPVQEHS